MKTHNYTEKNIGQRAGSAYPDSVSLAAIQNLDKQLWIMALKTADKLYPRYAAGLDDDEGVVGDVVEKCQPALVKCIDEGSLVTFKDAHRYCWAITKNAFIDILRRKQRERLKREPLEGIREQRFVSATSEPTDNIHEMTGSLSREESLENIAVLLGRAILKESTIGSQIFNFMTDSVNLEIVAHNGNKTKTSFNKSKLMSALDLSRDDIDKHYRVVASLLKNRQLVLRILAGEEPAGWYNQHARRIR